jgi:hypothetical protein
MSQFTKKESKPSNLQTHYRKVCRRAATFAFALLLIGLSPLVGRAQTCTSLTPSGDTTGHTDWSNINTCLNGTSHSATLGLGTFYIYQPITFPQVSGAKLLGSGNTVSGSVVEAVYASSDCSPNPSCFVQASGNPTYPLQYQPIILTKNAPNGVISNFMLSLDQLQRSYNIIGNNAIQVGTGTKPSDGTQVTSVRIVGSQTTTGWANGGGIIIVSSANCVVSNNVLKDFGFMVEVGGTSPGHEGIDIQNAGSTKVQNNTITRVSFGIAVENNASQTGNSSNTEVSGNNITGAGSLTCSGCSGGRAIKMIVNQSNGPALQYLNVHDNTVTQWGGPNQAAIVPSGLDLTVGVQYSTFTNNNIDGRSDIHTSYGLQVRSSFGGSTVASHHNTFSGNTFYSGGCSGCYDLRFNPDGPDQGRTSLPGNIDIGRHANYGANVYSTVDDGGVYRGCSQFAHAYWDYPSGQTYINRGQNLNVSAAGIRPDGSTITFKFYSPSGSLILTKSYAGGNGSCVMNTQLVNIDPAIFTTAGLYKVLATYNDGNSNAQIVDDWIGTGGNQVLLDVR